MEKRTLHLKSLIWAVTMLLLQGLPWEGLANAQEEVASAMRRYKDRDVSSGYYEQYEVIQRPQPLMIQGTDVRQGPFSAAPATAPVRIRTRLADSHSGIKFYNFLRCEYCHGEQAKGIHTVRANLTCRQCHGSEPIAGIAHFYSPLNPIRRHAYVCAKCHEGAGVSFATYFVHEPPAGSQDAKTRFPILYYAYWFMAALLVGTLGLFIPHGFLVGIRELIIKLKESKNDTGQTH